MPSLQAQAFFVSWFNWALLLWVCSILHAVYNAVIKQKSTEQYEMRYHLVCWGTGFVMALIPVLLGCVLVPWLDSMTSATSARA